jgi:hypothetical protein
MSGEDFDSSGDSDVGAPNAFEVPATARRHNRAPKSPQHRRQQSVEEYMNDIEGKLQLEVDEFDRKLKRASTASHDVSDDNIPHRATESVASQYDELRGANLPDDIVPMHEVCLKNANYW